MGSIQPDVHAFSCATLFSTVMQHERQGDPSGAFGNELDVLGDRCPSEYWVWVDYHSIKMFANNGAGGDCSDYDEFDVEPAAIEFARQDGLCSSSDSLGGGGGAAEWTCHYDPTHNRDWHDDVLCSNGSRQERPRLREWDDYITEDEIMQSAREYEQQLNRG